MITLLEDQVKDKEALRECLRQGYYRIAGVAGTGYGKTCVMASMASDAHKKQRNTLFLVHTDELVQQTIDKIRNVAPELTDQVGVVKAGRDEHHQPIVIASRQTLGRADRLERLLSAGRHFDLILCDECHHAVKGSQYDKIFEAFGAYEERTRVVGFTATLERADSKSLGDVWEAVAFWHDILELIGRGRLCDVRAISIRLEADFSGVKVRGQDYDSEEVAQIMHDANAPEHTLRAWRMYAEDRRTIIFCPNVALSVETRDVYRQAGVSAEMVSGNTPLDERREILRRFRDGEVQVICNCAVLVEGFDEPSADCIVMARPTRSRPFFTQCIGRGLRLWPGKKDCLVLDMVGATNRLDLMTTVDLFKESGEEHAEVAEALATGGLVELLEKREEERVRQGKLVARQVDLFNRKDLSWKMSKPGFWVLGLGDEGQVVVQVNPASNRWSVTRLYQVEGYYRKEDRWERLGEDLDLGYAMGVAEEYARQHGSKSLVDKNASWRQLPISPKQEQMLMKWHYQIHQGMTRGEASDIIDSRFAEKRMRKVAQ